MARKNKDIESLGFAILLLVAMCTGIFFLFKWLIAGIIAIISVIAVWAINLKKKKEKEMDIYGLEDWQKEEVRKGNYDSWNFEEEDLEEDDYFHDDSD